MAYNFVIIECLVSLWLAGIIWFYLFARLRRDNFRSRIRKIRDDLFDYMWKNGHDFNTQAYREVRQMFNGFIQLSNTFGPVSFFMSILFVARHESCYDDEDALEKLVDSPLKSEIQKAETQAIHQLIAFVYLEGLFGLFLKGILLPVLFAKFAFRANQWIKRETRRFAKTIAFAAGGQGMPYIGLPRSV